MSIGNVIATAGASTETAEETVFAKSTSLGFGPTYSLDNSATWNDMIAEYEYLVFNYEVDITGVADDVLRTITIKTADIRDDTRWRLEYGSGVVDFQPGALTGGDWTFAGATTDEIALEIRGRRAQNVVIPTVETVVDDQTASGYFDIGDMRVQWGNDFATGTTTKIVNFPAPFADVTYGLSVTPTSGGNGQTVTVNSKTTTSFGLTSVDINGTAQSPGFSWTAIGPKP